MNTLRFVKQFAAPLLTECDLTLVGRAAVVTPVDHLVKGIFIDRTGSPTTAQMWWFIVPLFRPVRDIYLHFGEYLPTKPPRWDLLRPGVDRELVEAAKQVLPLLRRMRSIADFEAFGLEIGKLGRPFGAEHLNRTYIDAALGRFESALGHLKIVQQNPLFFRPGRLDLYDWLVDTLPRLLNARDSVGVATFLHECEAYSVKHLKLEKLWQPSPFPIEFDG